MIRLLHWGVPENDYSVPQILGYYIRNIISIDLKKKIQASFLVDQKRFFGGYVKIITLLYRG